MNEDCSYKCGSLPECAPLASAYVPMQQSVEPNYAPQRAIARGTLFPGLDLPFMGLINKDLPDTPLGELMALDFAVDELELYLDTHSDDKEAFDMYQTILALSEKARVEYADRFGPITQRDMLGAEKYCWLKDPWPWDIEASKEV